MSLKISIHNFRLYFQDAHEKGYFNFWEYLDSDDDDEIVEAEVIEEYEENT